MTTESKERFLFALLRVKKATACLSQTAGLQSSELAVMYKAYAGCHSREKGFTVSQIQQSLHISKPAVSQILNGLEKKAYIVRSIDAGDRRKITVTLTVDGEAELREAIRCQDEALEEFFARFGEENIQLFIELVDRLTDALEHIHSNERCE